MAAILLISLLAAGDGEATQADRASTDPASYVNTSIEAQEAIGRAERQADAGRWREAAEALQAGIEKHGDRVMAAGAGRYVSVADFVGSQVARWPEAGLEAYRRRYESVAADLLQSARARHDPGALLDVSRLYFATAAGAAALDLAAQLAIERGSLAAARRWYGRLLAEHPDRDQRGDDWRAKRAICALLDGDTREADRLLPATVADAKAPPLSGGEASAFERLRRMREQIRDGLPVISATGDAVCRPDGDGMQSTAQAEAVWWRSANPRSVPGDQAIVAVDDEGAFDSTRADIFERALQSGRLQAFVPSMGDGRVFLHDARRAWSVDPHRPDVKPWMYRADKAPVVDDDWSHEEGAPAHFSSLYDQGLLYLNIELPRAGDDRRAATRCPALICLDATTGREVWRSELASFGSPFEETSLDGAPVLHEGILAALARRRKSFGFEACHLLRFDPSSGRLLSSTHLAEAPTGSYGYHRATRSLPSAAAGLIFAATNLGAVAATCAFTGRIEWIATYETDYGADHDALWPDRGGKPYRSWHYQPAWPWRDAVVCMPLDADFILVLEQDSGAERARIGLDELGDAQTIVGICGDRMYIAGGQVTCYDLQEGRVIWQRPMATGQLFGRGAVSSAGVFVPTDGALLTYPLDGGEPRVLPWTVEDAGNVALCADEIIVASSRGVYGVTRRSVAMERLRGRMAARPDDPAAALSLARLAFRFGDAGQGLDAARSAAERTLRLPPTAMSAARDRLFDALLNLAAESYDRRDAPDPATMRDEPSLSAAVEILAIAAPFAGESADEVRRTLLLARARVLQDRPADAIQTYQHLLADGRLRGQRIGEVDLRATAPLKSCLEEIDARSLRSEGGDAAGAVAERWIDAVMCRLGREHYDVIEREANARLVQATGKADGSALREVALAYPNSRAAFHAWRSLARLARASNDRATAVSAYRRALSRRVAERPETICEFVDYLLAEKRTTWAHQWLQRGAREYPALTFERHGATYTFDSYLSRQSRDSAAAAQGRPVCLAPPVDHFGRVFPDRVAALEPQCPTSASSPWDQVLVYSGELLEARSAATGRAVWPQGFACEAEPLWLGATRGLLIFATPYELFALTRTSGRPAWTFGEPPPADPLHEPEASPRWSAWTMDEDRVYLASDRGEIVCVGANTGELFWRQRGAAPFGNQLASNGRLICHLTWRQRRTVLEIRDARTGQTVHSIASDASRNRIALHVTPDDRLVDVTPRGVQCFDLATGKSLWRVVTDRHISAGAVAIDDDGVYVTDDGMRVTKIRVDDGAAAWSSAPLVDSSTSGVWGDLAGGTFVIAHEDRLTALDSEDGATVWTVRRPGCLEVQAPRLGADAVVTITRTPGKAESSTAIDMAVTESAAYEVRAFRLDDGSPIPLDDGDALRTPLIESFGGLYLRDQAMVILDGPELIGFAGRASPGN
jgi:outer membrane protein assembly factor BamB